MEEQFERTVFKISWKTLFAHKHLFKSVIEMMASET